MKQKALAQLTFKLHEAREKLQPSLVLRKRMLEKAYHSQLMAEKTAIEGHIGRLQPGLRKVYLERRLEKLNKKLG